MAESIGAARRNLSGGMTAIRTMQRRERAIVGGRYLNSAYGMPAASSLASRRSSNHLRNIACVQPVCPLLTIVEQLLGNNWRLTDSIVTTRLHHPWSPAPSFFLRSSLE